MRMRVFCACLALVAVGSASAEDKGSAEAAHEISAETPFVLVPVGNRVPLKDRFEVSDGKTTVRYWNIAWGFKKPDWYAPLDLSAWAGRKLSFRLVTGPENDAKEALAQLRFAAKPELPANVYDEPQRAQLHLMPTLGWTNDPNGLSYFNGEYHVFFQHNPCSRYWENMTWGHFVSKDLVHWTDVGDAIHPDHLGPKYSGSAVTDPEGTAGFGKNAHVLAYTSGAVGPSLVQCIAGSRDGRRYEKLATNPVIGNITDGNRDPKVFWHAASKQWVLCLYVGGFEKDGAKWHTVHLFNSPDLKRWKLADIVYGSKDHCDRAQAKNKDDPLLGTYLFECPDLVELKVAGTDEKRWVIWGATGEYGIGRFDGSKFVAEESAVKAPWNGKIVGGDHPVYAAQTFSGDPKGRTVWLPWMGLETDMNVNFNQGFGIPMALSMKRTAEGLRLAFDPVEEYRTLRDGEAVPFAAFEGELAEAFFEAKVGPDAVVTLDLRGEKLVYDAGKGTLSVRSETLRRHETSYRWKVSDGRLSLRLFVDRFGLEVLSDDGLQLVPFGDFWPRAENRSLRYAATGRVDDVKARAYRLRSIWEP